jgi:hypothetical protein
MLLRTIYGTEQAARQYWKKFMDMMEKKGFQRTYAEPCLLKRNDEHLMVVICVYVDDCLVTGERTAIDRAMDDIETMFEYRRLGLLKEYIGCSFSEMADRSRKLMQRDIIMKLESTFGQDVANMDRIVTPVGPGVIVERPRNDDEKIPLNEQQQFRSGVAMLLYLVKHSRPDLVNVVRELSKVMDGATVNHLKMLHRGTEYVLNTKNRGIRVKPPPRVDSP